jgi:hypothetical protein
MKSHIKGTLLKIVFLTIFLTAAFCISVPDYSQAESDFKGIYFLVEGRGNVAAGDEAPYVGDLRTTNPHDIGVDASGSQRVGAGIRFGVSWDFGVLYSGLNATGKEAPIVSPAFFNLYLLNAGTIFINPAIGYSASATSKFSFNVVDFEAGYSLNMGGSDIRIFGGLRYANTLHSVATIFYDGITLNMEREIEQSGIGPRLGVEAAVPIGSGGLRLVVGGSGSAMFGDRERTDTILGRIPPPGLSIIKTDNSQTFYNADAEIGLGYGMELGDRRSIMITMGYRGEAWIDATDTSTGSIAAPPGGNTVHGDTDEDQYFHGPFLRGTLNF